MTSRHAALLHCVTGALCKMDCDPDKRECEGFSEQGYVKLKRENDLAQTEIKEHMRVEDELKAELAEARKYWSLYFDECVSADVRLLIAQARIAELEKELAELHREWEADILAATDLRQDAARYRFIRNLLAIEDVERLIADGNPTPDEQESLRTDDAIDLALKSRA